MKIQREGLLVPESLTPPVDLELFESLQAARLDKTATYTQLSITGERKEAALVALRNGEDVDLTASHLDEETLRERLLALRGWKKDLLANDAIDPDLKQVYRWRVNEDIANVHLLEASRKGDMPRFRRWNEFIYDKPDEIVYRAALDWVANDAEQLLAKPDQKPAIIEAAQNVLSLIGNDRGYRELLIPEDEVFQEIREDQMQSGGYFEMLLDGVELPSEGKITKELGNAALQHIIVYNLKSDYGLRPSKTGDWSVNHAERFVEHPENYSLPLERFIGLPAGHEIGQHYLEYVNGMRADVRLLSRGLDRTEHGNESTALVREMALYKTFADFAKTVRWREIIRREVGIGFGYGVGDDEPRTTNEIYAFMNAIDTMYQAKLTPDDAEATAEKAHAKTGKYIIRTLRGGSVYLKDKVYPEGHETTWRTLAEKGPSALEDSTLGKYDINNSRHIQFLQNRGIVSKV